MSAALNISYSLLSTAELQDGILKTTEYLHMMSVFDSIKLRMLRRADYVPPPVSHPSLCTDCISCGCEHVSLWGACALSHSLLSLAFTTRWNHASIICKYSVVFNILKNYNINRCLPLVVFWIFSGHSITILIMKNEIKL